MKPVYLFALSCTLLMSACAKTTSSTHTLDYACDSGTHIHVVYPDTQIALVTYQGIQHRLESALSASGARYADEQLVWWSKGSEASLRLYGDDGLNGDILEQCRQQP